MFESFKAVCYFPLIVFAIGWGLAQISYIILKKKSISSEKYYNELLSSINKSLSNILFAGVGNITLLFIGIYGGIYVRWFVVGLNLFIIMFIVTKIGATIEFSIKKLSNYNNSLRLIIIPHLTLLSCYLISFIWTIYIFAIVGLY